jgi:chromosome segregation ATPase
MHELIVATYRALMTSLHTLPDEIATAQTDLTTAKIDLAKLEKVMSEIEASQALNVDGKNAEERKARLVHELSMRDDYRATSHRRNEQQRNVATLTNDVDNLTRQFAAVGYATKLHAGLMAYLATAAPGKEFDVTFGADNAIAVNGNGTITAADAAELGL